MIGPRAPAGARAHVGRIGDQDVLVVSWPIDDEAAGPWPELTPAMREVAALLVEGHARDEIARLRGRSASTVARQIGELFKRLGVGSRHELVALTLARRRAPR